MKEIENNPLEELHIRAENLQTVIQIAEMELECILRDIEKLTKRNPIGFRLNNKNENTTK